MTTLRSRALRALRYGLGFTIVGFAGELLHTLVVMLSQSGAQRTMLIVGPCIGWMVGAVLGGVAGWVERRRALAVAGALLVLFGWPWVF